MPSGSCGLGLSVACEAYRTIATATESIVIIFGFRMAFVHKSLTL